MKVRILSILAGPAHNFKPGDEPDLDETFALDLINGGFAVPAGGDVETTTLEPEEAAVTRTSGRRARKNPPEVPPAADA